MQLREGQAASALQVFEQHGLLHWGAEATACRTQLVQAWHRHQQDHPERHTLVLAQRWADVKPLSEQIRALRQAEGLVSQNSISLNCLVADRPMTFEFAVGDRIKLCKNDYRLNLTNGTLGTVTQIDPVTEGHYHITLRTDDERPVRIDTREYADEQGRTYLALAYALTVYASQGCTVDDTFVYYSGGMDRAHSYVAGSRHREQCHWFINEREMQAIAGRQPAEPMLTAQERVQTLAHCMSVNRHKQLAIEYVNAPASPPAPERLREQHNELELA